MGLAPAATIRRAWSGLIPAQIQRPPAEKCSVSTNDQFPATSPRRRSDGPEPGAELAGDAGEVVKPVSLSVIVPVYNDPANLEICLRALGASDHTKHEVIVVDDGSTDETPEVARRHGVRLIVQRERSGPAAARNRGAEAATHHYLFFVDADVRVQPTTLGRVAARFSEDPSVDAFFGSYDARPGAQNLVSQYRNLLHHYVHQTGNEEASTFWSGCGAIKRSVFLEVGGFDPGYGKASIEDIELGARLRRAGYRIALVKSIQVTHMKRWSLWRMVQVDVLKRGIPWTLLILRQGKIPNDLNLRHGQRLSALLAAALVVTLGVAPWLRAAGVFDGSIWPWWLLASACLAGIVALNLDFYLLLARVKSPLFVLLALPLHVLYYLCSGVAFAIGLVLHLGRRHLGRRREADAG